MTLDLCISDVAPAVGETIEVSVDAVDPDAELFPLGECAPNTVRFGDEEKVCSGGPACAEFAVEPDPVPGAISETVEHSYSTAGVYTITAILQSGSQCPHPYASGATADLRVTVG